MTLHALPEESLHRVLCVVAQPDDMEYGTFAAVARWTARGIEVGYLLLIRGDAGMPNPPRRRRGCDGLLGDPQPVRDSRLLRPSVMALTNRIAWFTTSIVSRPAPSATLSGLALHHTGVGNELSLEQRVRLREITDPSRAVADRGGRLDDRL